MLYARSPSNPATVPADGILIEGVEPVVAIATSPSEVEGLEAQVNTEHVPHAGRWEEVPWVRHPDAHQAAAVIHLVSIGDDRNPNPLGAFDDLDAATSMAEMVRASSTSLSEVNVISLAPHTIHDDRMPRPTPDGWR